MAEEFVPHSHMPYGEDGSGFYSDNVPGCYHVIREATPYVMNALDSIKFDNTASGAFTIADYGTADGGTSMPLMSQIIGKVKEKYGGGQEVHVCYEDQPYNDFKSLFLRLQGLMKADCVSYLKQHKHVFVTASGTGFYEQCFPTASVHLGFCATAMHWLIERPRALKACLHHTSTEDEAEKKAFADAAKESWERILVNRAKELAPGGHMVIANFCVDSKGQFLGKSDRVKQSMFANMTKHWKNMVADGVITQEEFEETTFNSYYRTDTEATEPFKNQDSAVYKAGLRLVEVKSALIPCPHHVSWMKSKTDDLAARQKHAKIFIPGTRVWSNSTFTSALNATRTEEDKDRIVDDFFSRYEADVARDPSEHAMDYVHTYVHFRKEH